MGHQARLDAPFLVKNPFIQNLNEKQAKVIKKYF